NVPALTVQDMKFPGATPALKLACGENASRGVPGQSATRAGLMRDYRAALINALDYSRRWEDWRARGTGEPPRRDVGLDNIAAALRGDLSFQIHCYRADDMLQLIKLSHEFGFRIGAFHHANEAFKIAPELTKEGIAVITWAGDWSGYKAEAYDSIMETPAFVEAVGGVVAMHSDDANLVQHLNQEAARSMAAGRAVGLDVPEARAIAWVTLNPAKILGIADRTGSLEAGKMADLILWDANPFSVYALPDLVFIDGVQVHDRLASPKPPQSDFELGIVRRRAPAAYPPPKGLGSKP
ncbi:MAG TPA: amidohydrolase family protein, partial [Phenylobacterium sp.]